MKAVVTVFSESASANLGDQAISRALKAILEPEFSVRLADFGGAQKNSPRTGEKKLQTTFILRRVAQTVPVLVRARFRWYLLGERNRMAQRYNTVLKESAIVVIGGGQLIKNNVALFCDKLVLLHEVARNLGLPYILVGVGVDRQMSWLTWRIVRTVFEFCSFSILRDGVSHQRIVQNLPGHLKCLVLPDLAFSLAPPISEIKASNSRLIDLGLNVMSFRTMLAQSNNDLSISSNQVTDCYQAMAVNALKKGENITLFTSGAAEDLCEAQLIQAKIRDQTGVEISLFHPSTLDDLLGFLVEVRDVVAARMHAGILAYVSGCNPICLNWDDKVSGVWSVIDQEARVVELSDFSGAKSAIALSKRLEQIGPAPAEARGKLAELVRTGVRREVFSFMSRTGTAQESPSKLHS